MDLSIELDDYKLNIRAGAIIIHEGKILTHKNKKENHFALIGGRLELGEDSRTTIIRELKEELGKEIEIKEYATTVENFFEYSNHKFHEIFFVYFADFKNETDKKINYDLKNIEGDQNLEYKWLEIDKLDSYNLLPISIKKMLMNNKFESHVINT